ncbi:5-oxoprolinase subunit PxpA [Dactylosporangium sp. NPDC051485]|uniref:LamB/YcsF family protein n=1 Tax=Dactylosporangium sp. NPDC051485 TaxID=3154846 RepID=UPI0034282060
MVDLNSDLGEGFGVWRLGDDDALLSIVTSANVACGFHAGDPTTMRRVSDRAAALGVRVGAQVSYRDLAGFGRRRIDVAPDELADELRYQIGALAAFAPVAYLKPHGALYNTAAVDPAHAAAVVAAACAASGLPTPLAGGRPAASPINLPPASTTGGPEASAPSEHPTPATTDQHQADERRPEARRPEERHLEERRAVERQGAGLPVLCQPGSVLARLAAEAGLRVVAEGFADRGYLPDGRLVPRGSAGALVTDVAAVTARAVRMAVEGVVEAIDGTVIPMPIESLCVHGDTPGAVDMAREVRAALLAAGVTVEPFV